MKIKKDCPKCSFKIIYVIQRGKWRCARCKYEWDPYRLSLHLSGKEWIKILRWFLHGLSSTAISRETGIHRLRILRALTKVPTAMSNDIPEVFSITIEIDETYICGQWKNKRKSQREIQSRCGRGTLKTPVFGILCRGGKVWVEVVPDVEAKTLIPLISRRVKRGSIICSDIWKSYTGIVGKGYIHRLVEHGKGEYTDKQGNYINGLEGFWGYLKRRLATKGGIRKIRLPLYLAEYVWRYNHRELTIAQQVDKLLNLLYKHKNNKFSG